MAKTNLLVNRSIILILCLYPTFLLALKGGMNGSLFLLAIICIYSLFNKEDEARIVFDRCAIAFGIAMSSSLLAILLSQIYHYDFSARAYDSASRFLLAIPIFLALRNTSVRSITVLQYGFPLGAIAALLLVTCLSPYYPDDADRVRTYFLDSIHLGDLALMLGFLSLFGVNWEKADGWPVLLLKMVGLASGVFVSILSGSRGGWVAIPAFLLIWFLCRDSQKMLVKLGRAIFLTLLLGAAAYFLVDSIHARLGEIYSDLATFSQGNVDTATGIRLQLWEAALYLFIQNPVFGVGAEGFSHAMTTLSQQGLITAQAAALGRGEVHNEILAHTVRFGIFGLAAILAIHVVPFIIFLRARKTGSWQKRRAAEMGLSLVAGFMIFGLTVETFDLKLVAAFYSLTVAALLAAATSNQDITRATGIVRKDMNV